MSAYNTQENGIMREFLILSRKSVYSLINRFTQIPSGKFKIKAAEISFKAVDRAVTSL